MLFDWPRAVSWASCSSSLSFWASSSLTWRSCCFCSSSRACRWARSMANRLRLQGASGPQPPRTPPPPPSPPFCCSCSTCCLSDATWEKKRAEVKPTESWWRKLINVPFYCNTHLSHFFPTGSPMTPTLTPELPWAWPLTLFTAEFMKLV